MIKDLFEGRGFVALPHLTPIPSLGKPGCKGQKNIITKTFPFLSLHHGHNATSITPRQETSMDLFMEEITTAKELVRGELNKGLQ